MPGKIAGAAKGMWGGLKSGLASAINWIIGKINGLIDTYNSTVGKIPGAPDIGNLHGITTGGGVPKGYTPTGQHKPGARAAGGPVRGGMPYLVGEKGPEYIIPKGDGTVIPNHQLGGDTVVHTHIHLDGKEIAVSTAKHSRRAALAQATA